VLSCCDAEDLQRRATGRWRGDPTEVVNEYLLGDVSKEGWEYILLSVLNVLLASCGYSYSRKTRIRLEGR
jgi:hypothetical protein